MTRRIALPALRQTASLIGLWLLAVLAACDGGRPAAAGDTPPVAWLLAGAASTTIDPPLGTFIAGDARNRRFTGVHDSLFARAVVFSHDDVTAAIVVVDNIGLNYPDVQRIQRRAAELTTALDLAPENVLVSSTHTHSGPDVVGLWGEHELHSGRDEAHVAELVELAAVQIAQAASRVQPVTLETASADIPLAWVENVTEPDLLDTRLTVVRLLTADGTTVATLTNYACHPTVLDGISDLVSADYLAGFYRAMSEALAGEHLFLQGAIGGWVQPVKGERTFELADRYGVELATAAQRALQQAEPALQATLELRRQPFEIPLENPGFVALLEAGVLNRPLYQGHLRTEVAYLAVGNVALATHPGETSPAHSLATRRLLGGRHTMVLGLTQDALGYILTPAYFRPGSGIPSADYLTATSVGPQAAPRMLEALEALIPER